MTVTQTLMILTDNDDMWFSCKQECQRELEFVGQPELKTIRWHQEYKNHTGKDMTHTPNNIWREPASIWQQLRGADNKSADDVDKEDGQCDGRTLCW